VIGRALGLSVAVLAAFYALVSLGFSCLTPAMGDLAASVVPQLALAEQAGGPIGLVLIALLTFLASFTSFNGALLSLSRFVYALAAQGVLPRRLGRLEPRSLVPRGALASLLVVAVVSTALVMFGDALVPSIYAAAVTASLMYAASMLARQRRPFSSPDRAGWARLGDGALALALAALGAGVVADAGPVRAGTVALLVVAYAGALVAAWRAGRSPRRPVVNPLPGRVPAHAD
jgi:APA family basic amino acid/polyamine antiporter